MDGFNAAREAEESWEPGPRTIGLFLLKKIPAPRLFYGTPFALLQRRELRTANYVPPATYRIAGLHSFRNVPLKLKSIGLSSTPELEEYKPGPARQAISLGLEYHRRSEGHHEENWGQHAPQRCRRSV